MKVSPTVSPSNAVQTPNAQSAANVSIRTMKMNTRATPGYIDDRAPQGDPPPPADPGLEENQQQLSNSDNTEGTTSTVEATQPISPQFAALAKQRRALQVKERELSDREKALEAKSQGSGTAVDMARLKSEPLAVLLEAGVTYEQLADAIQQNPVNAEVEALKAKIAALEGSVDKKFVDRDQQARETAISEMRREAEQLVNDGSETFELVRESRSVPDVIRLIEKNYDDTGEILSVSEALELVETELLERQKKLLSTKKLQGFINRPVEQTAQQPQQRPQEGMRTLTNKHTASIPMSAKDRALAAFRGTLKKG